jgi:hypothetical protein
MNAPRSVAGVLNEHVTLELEGIDRMYRNVYAVAAGAGSGHVLSFAPGSSVCFERPDGSDHQEVCGRTGVAQRTRGWCVRQ